MARTHSRYLAVLCLISSGITSNAAVPEPAAAATSPPESITAAGKVDAVTVYRGQALVTRLVDIGGAGAGPAGLREVIVSDLPEHVVPDSLYAEPGPNMNVRSVRFRVRPVLEDVREEVRKLEDQITAIQDQIRANQRNTELLAQHKTYLDRLEQFTATSATSDLAKAALNPESIKNMTLFLFEQRQADAKAELELAKQARDLNVQLQLLQRQHETVSNSSSKTSREAVVFIDLQQPNGQLRLHYLVDSATWSPSYNVRSPDGKQTVTVEYQASVQQMSGEDWNDVHMTLSTATPSLVAEAPKLSPLVISLAALTDQAAAPPADYFTAWNDLKVRKADIGNTRNMNGVRRAPQQQAEKAQDPQGQMAFAFQAGQVELDRSLNSVACEQQILELVAAGKSLKPTTRPVEASEGLSVTYSLDGRTSLPSRSDQQLIRIASLNMPAEFYKLASPVLTEYVYEEASLRNDTKFVLLAGPVSAYLADQFVGHGDIPTVTIGERFTVGFGIDSSLRASRELIDKTDSIQGGNRVMQMTYRLAIQNFGSEPATLRLLDRLPKAKDSQVQVSLVSQKPELSTDATYQRTVAKEGILRWDVQVPAQAAGPDALTVDYTLRLEYDKQMTIGGLADARK